MKKIILLICCVFLTFSTCSCSSTNKSNKEKDPDLTNSLTDVDPNNDVPSDDNNDNNSDLDNTPIEKDITCRIFLFDSTTLTPYYIDKTISTTTDNLSNALIKELQTSHGDDFLTLTDEITLTSSSLDEDTGILKITFSDDFSSYMPLGSSTESMLVSSIVNTLGYNLKSDKVAIYFGDTLYTGLRGELPEGYFQTYFDDVIEYDNTTQNNNEIVSSYRLYYYDVNLDGIVYITKDLTVIGGGVVTALVEALKTSPDSNVFTTLPPTTGVSSAKLDRDNDILTVNLNKDYYDILSSVGSSSESGLLDSLALTLGYNYGVTKIIINIDNKPYSGSHIQLEAGEYIDISNIEATALDQ